jgi:3-oxoacyl-ACP reductase-like protein
MDTGVKRTKELAEEAKPATTEATPAPAPAPVSAPAPSQSSRKYKFFKDGSICAEEA